MVARSLQASLASHHFECPISLRQACWYLGHSMYSYLWKPICPPLCFVFGWRRLERVKEMINSNLDIQRHQEDLLLENKLTFYPGMSPYFVSLPSSSKVLWGKAVLLS